MGPVYVLLSIVTESTGKTIDKLNFKRNRIAAQQLVLLLFIAMSVCMLLFIVLTHQPFPHMTPAALGLIAVIALVSFGSNAFDYLGLKADDLSLREPLNDFEPIVAGLIGYMLFPAERKPGFLLAFILGAVIVYWGTHRRRLRRLQRQGLIYLLIGFCLEAVLPSLYKLSLVHMSPAYITLFRVLAVLVLSRLFFSTQGLRRLSSKKLGYGLLAGGVYALGAVVSLYAIQRLGVVLTMLLMLFGPFLRYMSGYFILKENVRKGELVSSMLLAAVVLIPVVR